MNLVNLDNNTFGIAVETSWHDFKLSNDSNMITFLIEGSRHGKRAGSVVANVNADFGKLYEILGTASLSEITFDCEPYVEKDYIAINHPCVYKDYVNTKYTYGSKDSSFRSLLKSKGLMPTEETKILILKHN